MWVYIENEKIGLYIEREKKLNGGCWVLSGFQHYPVFFYNKKKKVTK